MDVGGHTRGHIAYYLPSESIAFVGDALFALGCGRMFEGTPQQFWASLKRLRSLPDETAVYWYALGSESFAVISSPGKRTSNCCFTVLPGLARTSTPFRTQDSL
jgi:hydroxyacylglutathione hydrolase